MREHDVTALTAAELQAARRELAASRPWPGRNSPVQAPIRARMAAIDAELAGRPPPGPGYPVSHMPSPRTAGARATKTPRHS